jgi:hypothetical protein
MGASAWKYFVAYQKDILAALQELRQEVFASGKYYKASHGDWRGLPEAEIEQRLQKERPEVWEYYRHYWKSVNSLPDPDTIERLLAWNMEEGTSCVIDMTNGISDEPKYFTVSPLTNQQLKEFFGTPQPTHAMIEEKIFARDGVLRLRRNWEGVYIIAYKDDTPDEICFAGFSGD